MKNYTGTGYDVKVEIRQTIFNLPEGYRWKGLRVSGTIYRSIAIENENGEVQWFEDIDLAFVDFMEALKLSPKNF
jgi:hypothetical protein